MIKSIFFDFDGTLCDTQADIIDTYVKVFAQLNIIVDASDIKIGPPLAKCIKELKDDISDEDLECCVQNFAKIYDSSDFPKTKAYENALSMLLELKRRGYPIFIATNKRLFPLNIILGKLGWQDLFVGLYGSDMLMPKQKLSKSEMLALALEQNHIDPKTALMVGDTVGDIIAGKANNMQTLAVRWGYAPAGDLERANPDFWADKIEDILNYVD